MFDSKLIKVFSVLSVVQKRQFKKWIQSPSHNKHQDVLQLFDYLYSRRSITAVSVDKKRIFNYLYPTKVYNDARLRHVMFLALEVLNDYVRFSYANEDAFLNEISLTKAYRELNLPKLAAQNLSNLKKEQDQKLIKNSTFFLQNYELEQERFAQIGTEQRTSSTNLKDITSPFTCFFILNTLKYACISQTHSNLRKEDYSIPLLEAVLAEVEKGAYQEIDAIMIYYHSYWALTEEDAERHFMELRSYLLREQPVLDVNELRDLYLVALNYCIKKLNKGEEEYVREAFEIYRKGLATEVLLEQEKLSRFAYKNIVALGLRAQEFDWVEAFIPKYAQFVDASYRDSYQQYNTSKLYFEKGWYSKAMTGLIRVEYDDVFLNLDAKIMLLKIYYANQDTDAFLSLIDSMKVYLGRKSKLVMSYHYENYKNILHFAQKIVLLNPYESALREALKKEIQERKPLTERGWLLDALAKSFL